MQMHIFRSAFQRILLLIFVIFLSDPLVRKQICLIILINLYLAARTTRYSWRSAIATWLK